MEHFNQLMTDLLPSLIGALSILIGAAITWGARVFSVKTGLEIEQKHRDALHSAVMSGVNAALTDGPRAAREEIVDRVIGYVEGAVPDALEKLGPSNFILRKLVEGKINDAMAKLKAAI